MSDVPPDEKTLLERIRGSWPENPLKRGLLRALLTCFLSGGVWMTHRLVAPTDFQMYNMNDMSQRALLHGTSETSEPTPDTIHSSEDSIVGEVRNSEAYGLNPNAAAMPPSEGRDYNADGDIIPPFSPVPSEPGVTPSPEPPVVAPKVSPLSENSKEQRKLRDAQIARRKAREPEEGNRARPTTPEPQQKDSRWEPTEGTPTPPTPSSSERKRQAVREAERPRPPPHALPLAPYPKVMVGRDGQVIPGATPEQLAPGKGRYRTVQKAEPHPRVHHTSHPNRMGNPGAEGPGTLL